MPAVVEAAAAAAAAAATGAFKYNRENYLFDAGLRFSRFSTGYNMVLAQTGMYREDIRDMTEFTVSKADTYHTIGVICFVLNFQLIMAGRLGVHGPAPPGWLLGLYWANISTSLMFLCCFTWMAMHSGARATAGGAHMLTRSVRLPVPTPKQLDEARRTGNSFEKQRVVDAFRIPFLTPAPRETEMDPETGANVAVSNRRIPRWYRDEVRDLRKDEGGSSPSEANNPEHFELYRGLQEEWWAYDVYSRIGILYFFSHWLTAASLYSMCHVFTELRCVWPAWTVVALFVTAHRGVLALDIAHKPSVPGLDIRMELVIPYVPLIAVMGMTLEYSVISPNPVVTAFIYVFAWICYIIQFLWALRLYALASPVVRNLEIPEAAGQAWWPIEWPLPPAFQDAVYLVAAPKQIEGEFTCLQQEMKAGKAGRGDAAPMKKARAAPPATLPWKLFRGACITTISMWVLIMAGRAFEMVNGERQLLKQEGRVERWPSHMQPWMAPWTRKGMRNEMCHAGGCDRRLSAVQSSVAEVAAKLGPLADALEIPTDSAPELQAEASSTTALPGAFGSAGVLASKGGDVLAVSSTGRAGVIVRSAAGCTDTDALSFTVEGAEDLGTILGASWSASGLALVGSSGRMAECPGGAPTVAGGTWRCQVASAALPAGEGAPVRAAAVTRSAEGEWKAAVSSADEEGNIVLYEQDHEGDWVATGEIFVQGRIQSLSFTAEEEGALLISTVDGRVLTRALSASVQQPEVVAATPPSPAAGGAHTAWQSACGLARGRVARLGSPGRGTGAPTVFVSASAAA